ncbi:MAG: HAD-IIB family hydrolase [Fimbriimonas sp.]|nr:HAD-IIB family hydrolase [Fimbriimonas sp.]
MKKLIVFDLDGTLAESKSALDPEMALFLGGLLDIVRVAVISGGGWPQFESQLLSKLTVDGRLEDLSLLPTCGTKFYHYESGWKLLYAENFTEAERIKILTSLKQVVEKSDFKIERTWGEQIEDRGSQITFSALGQAAPIDAKKDWDPDFAKRQKMRERLGQVIPEFSVRLGGTTSVDVTRPGIDKAYGIRKLRDTLSIPIHEMVFVGDALFPGGNDYPAKEAGVVCIQVRDPNECKRVIETILACLTGENHHKPIGPAS